FSACLFRQCVGLSAVQRPRATNKRHDARIRNQSVWAFLLSSARARRLPPIVAQAVHRSRSPVTGRHTAGHTDAEYLPSAQGNRLLSRRYTTSFGDAVGVGFFQYLFDRLMRDALAKAEFNCFVR